MNFDLSTTGIETKIGGPKGAPEFTEPVFIIDQAPAEGSKSWKFRMNTTALELLGYDLSSEEDQFFTFILGDSQSDERLHGRLFIGRYGNQVQLNKNITKDYLDTRSNKNVYEKLVEHVDWIDPSEDRNVFNLTLVENENGVDIAELTVYSEDDQERPDTDTDAQEREETATW